MTAPSSARAANGALLCEWNPSIISRSPTSSRLAGGVERHWMHGNALDVDTDGNLLVSFRNLGEITKIDVRTGDVIWRMGGIRNQFTFLDTPMPAFAHQHGVRRYGAGALVILDNIGTPTESRAERYVVDEVAARQARELTWYRSAVVTQIGGSVQPLPNGNLCRRHGGARREYGDDDRVLWSIYESRIRLRAQRIVRCIHRGLERRARYLE